MTSQGKVPLAEALRKAESWLDEIEGVEGVAQGKLGEEDCLTVFVSLQEATSKIPAELDGFKVVVELSGPFQSLA